MKTKKNENENEGLCYKTITTKERERESNLES